MESLYSFLKQKGIQGIKLAPRATKFDLFDFTTWKRGMAEFFASEKLEKVKTILPGVLAKIEKLIPESNSEFKNKIYSIAEMVCTLNGKGVPPDVIAKNIFKK